MDALRQWMTGVGWGPEHPLLHAAALVVLAVTALTLATMAYVLVFSARARATEVRRRAFNQAWRPRLALASIDDAADPGGTRPRRAREQLWWLMLWNRMQRQLRGESRHRLNRLLLQLGLERQAARRLRGLGVRRRLVALETMRHLGDVAWWGQVAPLVAARNPFVALAAAHALLAMAPQRGLALAFETGLPREDWSSRYLADLCHTAGPEATTPVLLELLSVAGPGTRARLAPLVGFADPRAMQAWAHAVLAHEQDTEVLLAALGVLGELADRRDHARLLGFLDHPSPALRLAVARALRRQSGHDDSGHFMAMLSDRSFGVRLEAAEALAALPGLGAGTARALLAEVADPYGRDQLARAFTEAGLLGPAEAGG